MAGNLWCQIMIPDSNLVVRLQQLVPNAMSGNILDENHPDVLAVDTLKLSNSMINDLTGIEHFVNATLLDIGGNGATVLAAWPPALLHIRGNNNYFPLPPLPVGLQRLNISFSNITSLPDLPQSLTLLRVSNTWLSTLPGLPGGLDTLMCDYNQLTSLPALPGALRYLGCSGNEITTLPSLPASLRWLSCGDGSLSSVPALPDSLEWLDVGRSLLTDLPSPLPSQLRDLRCYWNQLTYLPPLPAGLRSLICHLNQLTTLPTLPAKITEINCGTNQIAVLPTLPDSLVELDVHLNQLSTLPELPAGLEVLKAQENPLTSVPALPEGLKRLYLNDTEVHCLPILPSSLLLLYAYNTLLTCVPNRPAGASVSNLPICDVATSPCPVASAFITGHAFFDANGNGVKDMGEFPCPASIIEASPTWDLSGCDASGYFAMPVDTGSYVVDGHPVTYHTISTSPQPATLSSLMAVDSLNDIGYQPIPGIYDLMSHVWATAARPGFSNAAYLLVHNNGTETTTVDVQLDIDLDQVLDSSNVTPTTLIGNTATWSLPSLAPGAEWQALVYLYTADTVPLGTTLQHTLTAMTALPDTTPDDNVFVYYGGIMGSWDPNAKSVAPEHMSMGELGLAGRLTYTIQFQNTGTYHAERVVITDTLSSDLLSSSIRYVASSHACSWYVTNRVLHVIYAPIMLPDSTNNEPASHGFFQFTVLPSASLLPGSEILNMANIHFDFNQAVVTDPAVFTVDLKTGVGSSPVGSGALVWPVPAHDHIVIKMKDASSITSAVVVAMDGRICAMPVLLGNIIDIRQLASGTYVLRARTSTGETLSVRFLKD